METSEPRPAWRYLQWLALLAVAVVTLALGVVGFARALAPGPDLLGLDLHGWLDAAYRTLQLFVLEFDRSGLRELTWEINAARFLAPAIAVFTAIQALLVIFREQVALLRLRRLRHHVVICGVGHKGLHLARAFRRKGERVAVIERDPHNLNLTACRAAGCRIVIGDATHHRLLRRARVDRAAYLLCLMGRDGANAEAAAVARELVEGQPAGSLTCCVHINDPELWRLLREEEFALQQPSAAVRLEFSNIYETGVRSLLDRHPPFPPALGGAGGLESLVPHVLVVGAGRFGCNLIVRAAKDARLQGGAQLARPRVTIVDRAATERVEMLQARYPSLAETVELAAETVDVCSPAFDDPAVLAGKPALTAAYVCLADETLAVTTALALKRAARRRGLSLPVVVRLEEELGLARLLESIEERADVAAAVTAFGLLDRACTLDILVGGVTETIARGLHAGYVRHQQERGVDREQNRSVVPWDELPRLLRGQNRQQADFIGEQLRRVGYTIRRLVDWNAWKVEFPPEVIERLAIAEHERWTERMQQDGYRMTHPNVVDWSELPEADREKDRVFVRSWPSVLFLADFQIEVETGASVGSSTGRGERDNMKERQSGDPPPRSVHKHAEPAPP